MTSPFHAREITGKGRYYGPCQDDCPLAGDELYMSVTNAQSVVAKPALVPAAVKVTAAAAWEELPRMVALSRQSPEGPCARKRVADRCGECRFCVTAAIKRAHHNEWEAKAELGTRIHAHAHARSIGGHLPFDEEVEPYVDQYVRFLAAMGVDLDRDLYSSETTVYDPANLYAGTGDVALELPVDPIAGKITRARRLWLLDIKTSMTKPADVVYADQVLQLAGLRYAPRTILADDSSQDSPEYAGAAILNLRSSAHAMIPLPADETAHSAFLAAVRLQRFFHESVHVKAWEQVDTHAVPEPATTS